MSLTKPKKYKSSDYCIIEADDNNKTVMFKLPMTALFYDTDKISLKAQDIMDDAMDEFREQCEIYCSIFKN